MDVPYVMIPVPFAALEVMEVIGFFYMLKSQNFEIIYKIKVKNWIVFYLVLSF